MTEQTETATGPIEKMVKYAKWWEAEQQIVVTPATQIIRDKAIQTAYINLEMRYQTYARDSWVAVVLKAVSQTKSCDCETCQLWYIRENHIIEEIHKQLWIYHNNENERERC